MVFPGSGQFNSSGQWIMAAEIIETSQLFARTVATINPEWLEKTARNLCSYSYSDPHWEKKRGQVVAFEKVSLFGLVIEQRRRVNYGPLDPKISRQIFIQSALVECHLKHQFNFFETNRTLIQNLLKIEDKMRSRQFVSEHRIFEFYDENLPESIWDVSTLKSNLSNIENNLIMSESDVINKPSNKQKLELFPNVYVCNEYRLKLFYKFKPGSQNDGVSVHISQDIVHQINPVHFEWLVPGMLVEKVTFILRNFPKIIRKKLIPINQTALDVVETLMFEENSLINAILSILKKKYSIIVDKNIAENIQYPNHLLMRFCLVNNKGRVLKTTRSFADLFSKVEKSIEAPNDLYKKAKKIWEIESITTIPEDLPSKLIIKNKKGEDVGCAFFALQETGNYVSLKVCRSKTDAANKTKQGLFTLYCNTLNDQVRSCIKTYKFDQTEWPIFEWLGQYKEINLILINYILREILNINNSDIPSRKTFDMTIISNQNGELFRKSGELFDHIKKVLIERRYTMDHINKYEKLSNKSATSVLAFKEYKISLNQILSNNFLHSSNYIKLHLIIRYFKALQIRINRAHSDPLRDQKKRSMILAYIMKKDLLINAFANLTIPIQIETVKILLDEYLIMIEEFKISIFAPELKTSMPISTKRLDEKIKELEQILPTGVLK